MTGVLSLLLALRFFDGTQLAPGFQASAYARTLGAVPDYVETVARTGWRGEHLGLYGELGSTQGAPWTLWTVGATAVTGEHALAVELETVSQKHLTQRRLWVKHCVELSPEWVLETAGSVEERPALQGTVGWCPPGWLLGMRWDQHLAWLGGVQVTHGVWAGAGWDSGLTTFAHWRWSRLKLWVRQYRHPLLGSVQEVAVQWSGASSPAP